MRRPAKRSLLILGLVALWVLFVFGKGLQHAAAETSDLDTGNYHHLAWAIANGQPDLGFASSVLARHHLGEHCSPIMALVALPYFVWPSAYVLMVLQATAVVAGIAMTLWLALRELRTASVEPAAARATAVAFLLAMLLMYPPLSATYAAQFQPVELALPMVVASLLAIHLGRTRWLWLLIPLLLATRESTPLAVLGLAVYASAGHGRWRLALVLVGVAAAWAGIANGLIMPHFRAGETWGHTSYFGPLAAWDEKGVYLPVVLLGLGVFPLMGRAALAATLGAVPTLLLNVSVDRWTQYGFVGHYDAHTAPFLMIAAAHGIGSVAGWAERARQPLGQRVSFAMFALGLALAGAAWGVVGTKTIVQRIDDWRPEPGVRETLAEAVVLAERYRDAPAMTAHHRIGPHVAGRPHYLAERAGRSEKKWIWFASTRVVPGHVFLIPREDNPFIKSGLPDQVRRSAAAEFVERGDYVEVWRWPENAPEPGTDEARRYAAWRH